MAKRCQSSATQRRAWRGQLLSWPLDWHINCPKFESGQARGVRWTGHALLSISKRHFGTHQENPKKLSPKNVIDFKFVTLSAPVSYQFSTLRVGIEQLPQELTKSGKKQKGKKKQNQLCVQLHKFRTNKLFLLPIK